MKTILLTGDSRGLGNSIVKVLLKNDYRVIGISRTKTNEVNQLLKDYGEKKFIHINFDLSNVEEIKNLYKTLHIVKFMIIDTLSCILIQNIEFKKTLQALYWE